jgi:hypothetical protein
MNAKEEAEEFLQLLFLIRNKIRLERIWTRKQGKAYHCLDFYNTYITL